MIAIIFLIISIVKLNQCLKAMKKMDLENFQDVKAFLRAKIKVTIFCIIATIALEILSVGMILGYNAR